MGNISMSARARQFEAAGLRIFPMRRGTKVAVDGWKHVVDEPITDLEAAFTRDHNIAFVCGVNDIVDVDLDTDAAVVFGANYLPSTFVFGRGKRPKSHYLYVCPGAEFAKYLNPRPGDNKSTLVELRTGKNKYTLLPGSKLEDDGYRQDTKPEHLAGIEYAELSRLVRIIAAGSVLATQWFEGQRHDTALALAGALRRGEWAEVDATHFIRILCIAADDKETSDRVEAVKTTFKTEAATGLRTLRDLIDSAVVDKVSEWLELNVDPFEDIPDQPATQETSPKVEKSDEMSDAPVVSEYPFSPFGDKGAGFVEFPVEALPPILRDAVVDYQGWGQQPMALVVGSALGAAVQACQPLADIRREEGLESPLSLYLMTVGLSGERKTKADTTFRVPIVEWGDDYAEQWGRIRAERQVAVDSWEAGAKALKRDLEKIAGGNMPMRLGDPGSATNEDLAGAKLAVEGELMELRSQPPASVPRRLKTQISDCTEEALAQHLASGFPSLVLGHDEGAITLAQLGAAERVTKYLGRLNQCWGGDPFSQERATVADRDARGYRLSVNLLVQPSLLDGLVKGRIMRDLGLMSRFLLAYPPSTIGYRPHTQPGAQPGLHRFYGRLRELLNQPLPLKDESPIELDPPVLDLHADAHAEWVSYSNDIETQLRNGGLFEDAKDLGSKTAENAARLAGVFHLLEGSSTAELVSPETMVRGTDVARWYLTESGRVLGYLGNPEPERQALAWFEFIMSREGHRATSSEMNNFGPRPRHAEARNEATSLLARQGYIIHRTIDGKSTYLATAAAVVYYREHGHG